MITELGKELRKLRIDMGITLNDMAMRAGVSPSLLSSAETGKKTATPFLIEKLASAFVQVQSNKAKLLNLAEATKSEVRIRLAEKNNKANEVALAFARNFENLSPAQLDQLMKVFKKD